MKWVIKIWKAWWRWLATMIEMTVDDRPRIVKNRRQRRREEWERTHQFSAYWRDVPWYKIPQYMGGWEKIVSQMRKPKSKKKRTLFSRYRIVPYYQQCVCAMVTIGYIVQRRNWMWKWEDHRCFSSIEDAEDYIEQQENT